MRRGRILRSGMPAVDDMAPTGVDWPPRTVIDLRSESEREPRHPLAKFGSEIVNLPLLTALKPGDVPPEDLAGLYQVMINSAGVQLVDLVQIVSDSDGPVLIHCAAGKDRTGVSVALLLRLLGVAREDVVADYLASADAQSAIHARLRRVPGSEARQPVPAAYLEVPSLAMESTLDLWDRSEGGIEGWFAASGGTSTHVGQLRHKLLG